MTRREALIDWLRDIHNNVVAGSESKQLSGDLLHLIADLTEEVEAWRKCWPCVEHTRDGKDHSPYYKTITAARDRVDSWSQPEEAQRGEAK